MEDGEKQEIGRYLSDPEHQVLNRRIARIRDPKRRQQAVDLISRVADVPQVLDAIRRSILALK